MHQLIVHLYSTYTRILSTAREKLLPQTPHPTPKTNKLIISRYIGLGLCMLAKYYYDLPCKDFPVGLTCIHFCHGNMVGINPGGGGGGSINKLINSPPPPPPPPQAFTNNIIVF